MYHRPHVKITALFCSYVLAAVPVYTLPGCSPATDPPGGGGDQSPEFFLEPNLDPLDPELLVLIGENTNAKAAFFGTKDADGEFTQVQSLLYFADSGDAEPTHSWLLDERGRPTMLADAAGHQVLFDYDDANQALILHYRDAAGPEEQLTLDLSTNPDAAKVFALHRPISPLSPIRLDTIPQTSVVVKVYVSLYLVAEDAPQNVLGTVRDGIVTATGSNVESYIPPAAFDPVQVASNYLLTVTSRVANVQYIQERCAEEVERLGSGLTALQLLSAVIAVLCEFSTVGACGVLGGAIAGLVGVGLNIQSDQILQASKIACRHRAIAAAGAGSGRVVVTVNASVPRLDWSESRSVEYNLLNPMDEVAITKEAFVSFNVPTADCGGCPGGQVCNKGECVECVVPDDCADGTFCNPEHRCVQCLSSLNCRTSPLGPFCQSDGTCSGCTTNQQCIESGEGHACNQGTCVQCVTDADCQSASVGLACEELMCFGCRTSNQCINAGQGVSCQSQQCVECTDDIDCADGMRCNTEVFECQESDEPAPVGNFQIVGYTNTDCVVPESSPEGACGTGTNVDPSRAQIYLSGNPTRPTIGWFVTDVLSVVVSSGATALYGIQGQTPLDVDGNTEQVPFNFSSVAYGDYSRTNVVPTFSAAGPLTPENAVDLSSGTLYSITLFTANIQVATLTFRITDDG